MEKENKIKVINDEGKEVEVELLNVVEVDGKEFIIYTASNNDEYDDYYAMKIVTNENGKEDLAVVTDEQERELISEIIDEMTSETE